MSPAAATALAPVPDTPAGGLVERVQAAIQEGGLTQAQASAEIGISDAALSQWLRGRYPGDREAVAGKVSRWLESRAARAQLAQQLPAAPEWVETRAAARVLGALSYAQLAGDLAVVYGGAGTGKTVAARRYTSLQPNVWLATITAGARTIGPCLERVALAVGMRHIPSRSWRIESALVDRLRGTHGLVIADEAQHLDLRSLEALRGLHDAAGVGLALLGSELVYTRMTGGRSASLAQLWSRIGKRVRLDKTISTDVDEMALAFGVSDPAARRAVRTMATSPVALRGVVKTLRLASLLAAGAAVGPAHVLAAQKDLGMVP